MFFVSGTLFLCATPIGNLSDISLRVLELLKQCDYVAAEDTRHTLTLLNHFEISAKLISYHEHNKQTKGEYLVELLKDGKNIALVSDAGMPGISDPGADMVKLCQENDIPVTVAPGANAALSALVLSGFDTRRFVFEGFLPADKKEKKEVLESLEKEFRTIVFYEAPHRLTQTLKSFSETFGGDRNISAVRELTKKFEEVKKGTIDEILEYYTENQPKGEFVLVVEGFSKDKLKQEKAESFENMSIEEHMSMYIQKGMSEKDAMKAVAKDRGVSKREIYSQIKTEK